MTKKCMICKTEATPISNARRSFHMFPKNELLRKKWMDAMNLLATPNFKTAYICSDHFDDKSFHDTDELRSRKRLRPDAVPQRISLKESDIDDPSEEKDLGSEELFERPVDKDHSKSEMVTDLSDTCIKAINEQDCLTGEKSNSSMNNVPNSGNRRKNSFIKEIPRKRIRFMNGFQTEHITREDFVSDEAWNRFLRLITYERNRMAAAHNRNSRKEKKIKNFKLLLRDLENRDDIDAAQYVKQYLPPTYPRIINTLTVTLVMGASNGVLCYNTVASLSETCDFGVAVKVLTRMKEHKFTTPFPVNLRNFTRILHFHSLITYKFVTCSFFNCLPLSGIVRRKLMKEDLSPYFGEYLFKRRYNRLERIKAFFDVVVRFQSHLRNNTNDTGPRRHRNNTRTNLLLVDN